MNELYHYGVKGMKWGTRNYQNYDGTWTDEGKARRRQRAVFISGSSKTETKDSPYYRKQLPKEVKKAIDQYIGAKARFIVGDAPGIDRQVQRYLNRKGYKDVDIYGPGKQVRYTANKKWRTHPIDAPEFEEGSKEWLAKKDIAMEEASTEGIAVVLDEGAKATRKNVDRLIENNKNVMVYQLNKDKPDAWANDTYDVKQVLSSLSDKERRNVLGNKEYTDSEYSVYRKVKKVNGKPAGFVEAFKDPDLKDNEAVIITAVGKNYRGRGLATSMVKDLVDNIPDGIDTLYFETTKSNHASARTAMSAGFAKGDDYNKDDANYVYRKDKNK